jgi:outer membrane protein assembly factor BamB
VRGALSVGRDGKVFTGTYGPAPRLVALDPEDGRERFAFSVRGNGAPEFGIHGGPTEDAAGRLYFGAQDDQVYCLGPDGKLIWKWKTGGDVDAPIVITPEGRLLVGSDDGKLYALAAD